MLKKVRKAFKTSSKSKTCFSKIARGHLSAHFPIFPKSLIQKKKNGASFTHPTCQRSLGNGSKHVKTMVPWWKPKNLWNRQKRSVLLFSSPKGTNKVWTHSHLSPTFSPTGAKLSSCLRAHLTPSSLAIRCPRPGPKAFRNWGRNFSNLIRWSSSKAFFFFFPTKKLATAL